MSPDNESPGGFFRVFKMNKKKNTVDTIQSVVTIPIRFQNNTRGIDN